ncbi:CGNR zinc finger domain-containing protein [Streptomyces sp. NPDC005012]|uniref:CGNR zinc finger domain-containing protein n=1 Tax=unclassified Streptomyces TaxID=2593676 RepID=UPI0033B70571
MTGEPLAVDLLNTRWIDADGPHDLLDTLAGTAVWLSGVRTHRLLATATAANTGADTATATATVVRTGAVAGAAFEPDGTTRARLLTARAALDLAVADPEHPSPEAVEALNAVLAHGRLRPSLTPSGPDTSVEVDEASWLPAWAAAADWLDLLAARPDRIRACANPACVLHFFDVSKNGTRRWCSMAGCGNRAKAQRHYARSRQD